MLEDRLKLLRESLNTNKLDALLVTSSANIFYLTGLNDFIIGEREAYLFVSNKSSYLFTSPLYFEGIKDKLPKEINPLLFQNLFETLKKSTNVKVGFENNFTVAELKRFKKETGFKFILTNGIVEQLRVVKDEKEIKNIRLACELTDKTFEVLRSNDRAIIRSNISEKELAWEMEKFIRENGGEMAFDTIVAFGPNSAVPHHKTSDRKLKNTDEFILMDFGVKINGYTSDMSRTLLTKSSSNRAKEMFETVLESQEAAVKYIKSHISNLKCLEIAETANEVMRKYGFEDIPHGLGHGFGIEVHELPHLSPRSKGKITKGMVFTIEPGIYIPGFGGVRIEDDYLISDKLEQMTKSPK